MNKKAIIYDGTKIAKSATVSEGAIIYPNVEIDENVFIGPYSIIGEPCSDYYKDSSNHKFKNTFIGKDSVIRSHSVIYEDVVIGEKFQSGHRITIREKTVIGTNCSFGTLCDIQGRVNIGDYVRFHSNVHIGQFSEIDSYVWIYPYVILTNDPYPPMGKLKGVKIEKYAQIFTSSIILPGVHIGENAIVGAASNVTKDVNKEMLVVGNPAREKINVRNIKDEDGNQIYPWREFLVEDRGYPWQK